LLRRLNDLAIFDPARWPAREILARTFGCLAVSAFLIRRILQLPSFPGVIAEVRWAQPWFAQFSQLPSFLTAPTFDLEIYYSYYGYAREQIRALWTMRALIWLVETGILLAYIVAFLTRKKARSVARGFMETVFPLLLGLLPFTIVMTNYTYHEWFPERSRAHLNGLYAVNAVLIAGGAANVIGLLMLRPAFTIMSEARVFVRSGLYRFIRHPLYASHFVIYLCYTLLHFHAATAALYVAFVVGQTLRARIEERKMSAVFPEYEEYRRTTGMYFPRLWRGEARSQNQESKP
jgi:protein-S-isoprenylcysteine O-methyltransferase Ste14